VIFSGNMLLIIFGIIDVLVISLYQGLLLTELLHPVKVQPFLNADDMIAGIAKKDYKLLTYYPGNWLERNWSE
jgi:hypothetical protein